MATREQDQRRRARIRANGPAESYTRAEIGERDSWVCGICCDPVRLVELPPELVTLDLEMLVVEDVAPGEHVEEDPGYRRRRRPLSASIDHIVPVHAGGADSRSNVQIAHLFCNLEKNDFKSGGGFTRPEYMRALLTNLIDGTPIPEEVHRGCFLSWAYPARRQIELVIALYIAAGIIAADPRFGDQASRLGKFALELGQDRWEFAVEDMRERHAKRRSRWQVCS